MFVWGGWWVPDCMQAYNTAFSFYRLQAIQTVQKLGFMSARSPLTKQERDKFSETFVNFLPGILQAMTKVAKESDIQGSKIIAVSDWEVEGQREGDEGELFLLLFLPFPLCCLSISVFFHLLSLLSLLPSLFFLLTFPFHFVFSVCVFEEVCRLGY